MSKFVLTVDSYTQVENAEVVRKGALEGRVIPPVFVERRRGDVFELDGEEAERLQGLGAVEKPGESQKREADALAARREQLEAEIASLDATADSGSSYEDQSKDELQAEADRRELTVEGSGSGGNVTKADLVAALRASDGG